MAYNPGIQYRGDQYLFQALTNLGEKAGEAITNYRKDRAESQFLEEQAQGLFDSARQHSNLVRLDDPQVAKALEDEITDLGKFGGMSLAQKRAKVGQLRFQIDSLMKAGQTRQEGRRADEYLGLQRQNVALGQQREAREVAQAAAQRQAGQRFLGEMDQATRVPAGRNFSLGQEPSGVPQQPQLTVQQILAAGARAGGDLDPRLMGQVGELLQRGQQWNLQPGQEFNLPGGAKGVATSPGQLQLLQPRTTIGGRGAYRTRIEKDPITGNVIERVVVPMTSEEVEQERQGAAAAVALPMPDVVKRLINEYAENQAKIQSGDKRHWGASRAKRNDYIKTQLESLGYDTRGQWIAGVQEPGGAAIGLASAVPAGPTAALPVFSGLQQGGRTNWEGANIVFKGRRQ